MSAETAQKILLVDDDVNLLSAIARQFRNEFDIITAEGGIPGLQAMKENGPFAVVISDFGMPDMNGIQFLAKAREIDPDTVRIMLTGNADLDIAMHAVNEGNIFRFLVKPCRKEMMEWAISAALEQYGLVTAERELLERTLKGCLQVLTDIMALANPLAFSRASRLKDYVAQIVKHLNIQKVWEVEIAALLSQIGCVALPADILSKVYGGITLTDDEQKMYASHPSVGCKLLSLIPRLEVVGQMVEGQNHTFKQTGATYDGIANDRAAFGAQILKVCIDFDTLSLKGVPRAQAIAQMKAKGDVYHPGIIRALERVEVVTSEAEEKEMPIRELTDSMALSSNVYTRGGLMLAPKGHKMTLSLRIKLENYALRNEIDKKIWVTVPSSHIHRSSDVPSPTAS